MRTLKILVVVMGIMLVGGFAILVAVIAGRVANKQAAAPSGAAFVASPIDLPADARIEAIGVGADRLVLHLALPDGNRELVVIDLTSGKRLGTIPLRTTR